MKKYLDFKIIDRKPKTNVYAVLSRSDGSQLGKIYWYAPWRQYVFEPTLEFPTQWSPGCQSQLSDHIQHLMIRWRIKNKRPRGKQK